jgi:nicotinate-nucleotide adenylyltransferase
LASDKTAAFEEGKPALMSATCKIGIFGGTFDPVHLGHVYLAGLAKESLGLNEVRFLPCQISPHKTDTAPASGDDRCEMLRRATANLPWAVIDESELHQAGPSYSYQTAEALAAEFPNAQLFWIMGSDQWEALPRWKNPDRLAKLVEFVVLTRGEAPQPRAGYRLHFISGEHPASATAIRTAISSGAPPPHDRLHPAVAKWIYEKGLYR